jgi:anti-sigma factor RsiW
MVHASKGEQVVSGCAEWGELLSASLDGALTLAERERTEAHVAACADCRERLGALRALKHAIARLPSREDPPGAVRAHVESLVHQGPRRIRVGLVALAASLVAVGALVASWRTQTGPSARLADELAADHLHSLPEAMPAEVVTEDPLVAIRFFSERVPFRPVAPRLPGTRLIGGRLCKIQGRRVQLLFYHAEPETTVSLFVSDQTLGAESCREARGLQVCGRRAGALTLLAVGGIERGHLRRLLDGAVFSE